jgi:hypothetical protein
VGTELVDEFCGREGVREFVLLHGF